MNEQESNLANLEPWRSSGETIWKEAVMVKPMSESYLGLIRLESVVQGVCILWGLFAVPAIFMSLSWLLPVCLKCLRASNSGEMSEKTERVKIPWMKRENDLVLYVEELMDNTWHRT